MSGSLFMGGPTETFSNIKTPQLPQSQLRRKARSTDLRSSTTRLNRSVKNAYRPRYLAHLSLLSLAAVLVLTNSTSHAHALSVRLLSAHAGVGGELDATGTASVAADIASSSHLLVASEASKTATQLSEQVALPTTDDTALAMPQVVTTAGDASRSITSYTVIGGDTLSTIASKFNITTNTIMWANNLTDANSLAPGQKLVILPITGLLYKVQAGDTAAALASTYNANAEQILSYNNAEVKGLVPGEQIIIPDGTKPLPAAPVTQTVNRASVVPQITRYAFSGNAYAFGYCTWYVANRRSVPSYWGDARDWYYNAQASGFSVGSVPVAGAIAWTGAGAAGHVAYVESVSGSSVTISEMNATAGWDRVDTRTVPASSFRYIY